jgi:hypothetical protein
MWYGCFLFFIIIIFYLFFMKNIQYGSSKEIKKD